MDQSELDKCKSDVVYFGEKYLGIKLLPWQKTYLRLYQKGILFYFTGIRNGRTMIRNVLDKWRKL